MIKFRGYVLRRNVPICIFIVLSVLYISFIIISRKGFFSSDPIGCFRIKGKSLLGILDDEPPNEKSIFFHETSCNSHDFGKIVLSSREACAVESAALVNPNTYVYLLFTSPGVIKNEGTESDRILQALLTYSNIKIRHLNYENYMKNTPLENFYRDRIVESSTYSLSHASDVLRYLTLWKYGGIYLDLDVVVLKPLENLLLNYAGAESDINVAAGVLSFTRNGIGHNYSELCLEDLRDHFNGNDWGYNGPGIITRLLQNICKEKTAKEMIKKNCQGFKVYPPNAFYLVPWWNWTMYFNPEYNYKLLEMTKVSYIIHVWNKLSVNTKISVNSDVPYSIFAKQYCPKVFAECDEYF